MCNADPLCKAFVYLPNGIDSLSEVGRCPAGLCRVAGWPVATQCCFTGRPCRVLVQLPWAAGCRPAAALSHPVCPTCSSLLPPISSRQ